MELLVVFALFVFMLTLLCFFDATVFSVNKDLYKRKQQKLSSANGIAVIALHAMCNV